MILLLIVCALVTGCTTSQTLTYDVLFSQVSLERSAFEKAPDIIVIASKDDIVPPAKGVTYPKSVLDILSNLDYNKSIAVFFLVGQVQKDTTTLQVLREGHKVTIELKDFSVGPGNYELPGFTMPYELITIGKSGAWGDNILFQIKANETYIIGKTDHFVP